MPYWDAHDDWYDHHYGAPARPAHHRHQASYLHPHSAGIGSRHRSRSQGHSPSPNIHIYNRLEAENMAPPHAPFTQPYYSSANALAEQVRREQMMLARRPSRSRSRSRSSSPAVHTDPMLQERIRDLGNRQWMETEDERLRLEIEKDRLREQLDREHRSSRRQDEDKWKNEWKYRQVKDEARRLKEAKEAEEAKAAIIAEHEAELKAQEEAKKAAVAEYMRKKTEEEQQAKEAEEALRAKIKREEAEQKEKAEKEMKEFLQKQKEKEMKEKEKKKKKEEELKEEVAKRLSKHGFQHNQIDAMFDPKHHVRPTTTTTTTTAIAPLGQHGHPTYIKVHCDHIAAETLQYYNIPWQWDRVSKKMTPMI